MKHDSIALVYVGRHPERSCTSARHELIVSTLDPNFKERFKDWQLEQYLSEREVGIIVRCFQSKERVEIETRFPNPFPNPNNREDDEEVGANVDAILVGEGDFSNICIGVLRGKYRLIKY